MANKKQQKYELLSPAGNIAKAKYALEFGADAIYLGVSDFSLRVRINQFTEDQIKEIIEYAHNKNKKVYVTANILAHNRHLKLLPKFFRKVEAWQADGVIISDPGVITLAKKYCPNIPIHLSTQANCTNFESAKVWFNLGVKRIILGREVTLKEIGEIHKKIPKLELEYFVHGAMCMSYSGRCLLSSYFLGRSANLGDCVQPCRWEYNYYLEEKKRPGKFLKIEEDDHGSYILNSKDLCLIKYLDDLKKAGITSFKIEGRAKSIYYVSLVSQVYKQALSMKSKEGKKPAKGWPASGGKFNKLYKELETLVHRGYTIGFLFGKEKVEQRYCSSHIVPKYQFVGEVIKSVKCKAESLPEMLCVSNEAGKKYGVYIKVHNVLKVGDNIEIIEPSGIKTRIKIKKIYEQSGEEIEKAHGGQERIVVLHSKKKIQKMAVIRKKIK